MNHTPILLLQVHGAGILTATITRSRTTTPHPIRPTARSPLDLAFKAVPSNPLVPSVPRPSPRSRNILGLPLLSRLPPGKRLPRKALHSVKPRLARKPAAPRQPANTLAGARLPEGRHVLFSRNQPPVTRTNTRVWWSRFAIVGEGQCRKQDTVRCMSPAYVLANLAVRSFHLVYSPWRPVLGRLGPNSSPLLFNHFSVPGWSKVTSTGEEGTTGSQQRFQPIRRQAKQEAVRERTHRQGLVFLIASAVQCSAQLGFCVPSILVTRSNPLQRRPGRAHMLLVPTPQRLLATPVARRMHPHPPSSHTSPQPCS